MSEQSPNLNKITDAFYARIQKAQAESGWPVAVAGEEWFLESPHGRQLMGTAKRSVVDRLAKAGWLTAEMNPATGFYELYIR